MIKKNIGFNVINEHPKEYFSKKLGNKAKFRRKKKYFLQKNYIIKAEDRYGMYFTHDSPLIILLS
jgi:hypothetical protein